MRSHASRDRSNLNHVAGEVRRVAICFLAANAGLAAKNLAPACSVESIARSRNERRKT
jgi:hypothetical protein